MSLKFKKQYPDCDGIFCEVSKKVKKIEFDVDGGWFWGLWGLRCDYKVGVYLLWGVKISNL